MREAFGRAAVICSLLATAATSRGDVATTSGSHSNLAATSDEHVPSMQFPLEPGVIRYEQLKPAEQAAIDQLRETVETTQLPASHEAFSRAAGRTAELVEREIAARSVGLVGTDQDGVVTP